MKPWAKSFCRFLVGSSRPIDNEFECYIEGLLTLPVTQRLTSRSLKEPLEPSNPPVVDLIESSLRRDLSECSIRLIPDEIDKRLLRPGKQRSALRTHECQRAQPLDYGFFL